MNKKLNDIYEFLEKNRGFNCELQTAFYKSIFSPHDNVKDKTIALLYHIANTQSQPKINDLARFFEHIITRKDKLSNYNGLLEVLKETSNSKAQKHTLFNLLEGQHGWGPKTAALFTKCIFQIHFNDNFIGFRLWDGLDINAFIGDNGIKLPVDSVITFIFEELKPEIGFDKAVNFENINEFLKDHCPDTHMEVWDDLWFWGYFTQLITKDMVEPKKAKRLLEWNKEKYWANPYTNKEAVQIKAIEKKAKEFIKLLNGNKE